MKKKNTSKVTVDDCAEGSVSLLPHYHQKAPFLGAFLQNGHNPDTFSLPLKRMRPPSEPVIDRTNPNMYFISWNHDVPVALWDKYKRKRKRIKVYPDINRLKGQAREDYAEQQRLVWKYALQVLKYNPFEEELLKLEYYQQHKTTLLNKIQVAEEKQNRAAELSTEEKRKLLPINQAFNEFMNSRRARKLAPVSISAYQGAIDWLYEGLSELEYIHIPIGQLKHIHISGAVSFIAEDRDWEATTINKGIDFAMSVFNWLETEDYVVKNPSKGKFIKLPTNKNKHRWYDREMMKTVVTAIIAEGNKPLLRACQFTYELMIRSKKELRKLKVGDIDRVLKRVRYSAELSKTSKEEYRDYTDAFEIILQEMNLERYPAHFYIFGSGGGIPGIKQCGHNYFSKMFMAVKTRLNMSMDYTIYGFKHTRIVHELMKKTDGYLISHMARHGDRKSTQDYMRDYDVTLTNIYTPEDLRFYRPS